MIALNSKLSNCSHLSSCIIYSFSYSYISLYKNHNNYYTKKFNSNVEKYCLLFLLLFVNDKITLEQAKSQIEEKNIETISAVAPQRATVIQLVEGESNEMITHIIPPEGVPEMVTAVPEEKSELELKTVWNHAYIDLKPSGTAITSMDEKLINHAVKYVEDNIARSDLSVEELSKELGMSRVHLYKKLLAITGKTPIEFIRIIRLKRAAQLLRGSQQNISEIAYQVGFNNPKYFSRYFKEEFGILPSAFQYKQGR